MKKVITSILMVIFFGLKGISQVPVVNKENNEFFRTLITSEIQNITNTEIEKIISNLELSTFSIEEFDLNTQYTSRHENANSITITVNSINNTQEASLGLTFILDKTTNELNNRMVTIVRRGRTLMYDINDDQFIEIKAESLEENSQITINTNSSRTGCGQKVIDCIQDAYTQHGWASVWALVQTAFIPETAVAIAYACCYKNCSWCKH
jgi:hypothetical protein